MDNDLQKIQEAYGEMLKPIKEDTNMAIASGPYAMEPRPPQEPQNRLVGKTITSFKENKDTDDDGNEFIDAIAIKFSDGSGIHIRIGILGDEATLDIEQIRM